MEFIARKMLFENGTGRWIVATNVCRNNAEGESLTYRREQGMRSERLHQKEARHDNKDKDYHRIGRFGW